MTDCVSCGEVPEHECPKSERPCGHHCNHSWTHDICHWCGAEFGEDMSRGGRTGLAVFLVAVAIAILAATAEPACPEGFMLAGVEDVDGPRCLQVVDGRIIQVPHGWTWGFLP